MADPIVKMIAVSNVFSRLMHFENAGDVEIGHCHNYDHATLVSSGAVCYEVLDGKDGNTVASKKVIAPNFVFVDKNKYHRLVALEPNTVCACIHALRTVDGDLIYPACLIEPFEGQPAELRDTILDRTGIDMKNFCAK